MDNALIIRVRRGPGHSVLTAAGEIDSATVTRLREQLFALAEEGRPVIADLDQVSFIDATGLGALAGAARRAAAHGASLHVVCARPQTRKLSSSPSWTASSGSPAPSPGQSTTCKPVRTYRAHIPRRAPAQQTPSRLVVSCAITCVIGQHRPLWRMPPAGTPQRRRGPVPRLSGNCRRGGRKPGQPARGPGRAADSAFHRAAGIRHG